MTPIHLPQANIRLTAPPGQEDKVQDITAVKCQTPEGYPQLIMGWALTMEERLHLLSNGILYLSFIGHTIPPVLPMVTNPFEGG